MSDQEMRDRLIRLETIIGDENRGLLAELQGVKKSVDELKALSARGASELLTRINARAHSLQLKDNAKKSSPSSAQFRFNLGIFNYSTAQPRPEETSREE
mgnify:CR=1 FL=1